MAPYDISTRALVVSLKATSKSNEEIAFLTSIKKRTIYWNKVSSGGMTTIGNRVEVC